MSLAEVHLELDKSVTDPYMHTLINRLLDCSVDESIKYHDRMVELLIQHFPGMAPALRAVNTYLIEGDAQGDCLRFIETE